jgi:hypothetical protein
MDVLTEAIPQGQRRRMALSVAEAAAEAIFTVQSVMAAWKRGNLVAEH